MSKPVIFNLAQGEPKPKKPTGLFDRVLDLIETLTARVKTLEARAPVDGKDGLPGRHGIDGKDGKDGRDGVDAQGLSGKDGASGRDGLDGKPGEAGPRGEQGLQGRDGRDGVPGPQGLVGERGSQGEPGPQGETGQDGPRGDAGPQGEIGPRGQQGEHGPQGEAGASITGASVNDDGVLIIQLSSGQSIEAGVVRGRQGDKGDPGPQGEPGNESRINNMVIALNDIVESARRERGEGALTKVISGLDAAIRAMNAPKEIIKDSAGKPIGIRPALSGKSRRT